MQFRAKKQAGNIVVPQQGRFAPEAMQGLCVGELMGANPPKTIPSTALASEALVVMEQFKITTLVVQDAPTAPPIGVVHLHELLKSGL